MSEPHAYTFPNSHNAHMGEMMSPLVPDRVCELSVECCFLRNDISDKSYQNDQLQSTVNRMKTAVKRGSGTLQATKDLNKALETENAKLVAELMTVKKKLLKAESNVSFQAKVIGNNRKVIEKLKAPAGSGGKFCKNVAQLLKENVDLNEQVERLTEEVAFEKAGNVEKQAQLTKHEYNTAKLQNQICALKTKLTSVQNDLRSEKATVSQLREKHQQEDLGELSYTNAFIDLEEAYEELHTKYEKLWAERDTVLDSLNMLQNERNFIYAAAKKSGVRIDTLLHERELEAADDNGE